MKALKTAATLQQHSDNLVPEGQRLPDFLSTVRHHSGAVMKEHGLNNRHDLKAAYACERYRQMTGMDAPVIAGQRKCSRQTDRKARAVIAQELGHHRRDVVASYIGSSK
ncbi:MAG: hypothetical protein ACR2PT_02195 [Endozoicomonas sp.]